MLVRSVYWTNVSPSLKNLKIIRYESIKRGQEKYSLFYVSLCFIFGVNFCYCEKFQLILPQFPPTPLSRTTYPQVSGTRTNCKVNWDEVPSWNLQIPDPSFISFSLSRNVCLLLEKYSNHAIFFCSGVATEHAQWQCRWFICWWHHEMAEETADHRSCVNSMAWSAGKVDRVGRCKFTMTS